MAKRALVFSSGGAKAAFQAGAAEHLIVDRGLDFDVIAGVSSGCLNAAFLAQGKGTDGLRREAERLRDLWLGIGGPGDIYERRMLSPLLFFFTQSSLFATGPLREAIHEHLDPERLRASGRELRIGAVELESGKFRLITQNEPDIREWLLASASYPLAFPPVEIGGAHVVDGGVRQFSPLEYALDAVNELGDDGEDREVYCLMADPLEAPERSDGNWDGPRIAERVINIAPIAAFRSDFATAIRHNRAVRAYLAAKRALEALPGSETALRALETTPIRPPAFRETRLVVVAPERELMGSLEFDPAKIRGAYEAGRRAARSPLDEDDLDRLIPQES